MKSDHYPIVTSLIMENKRRIKRTFRKSQSGWQFGGDNGTCKFNDMFLSMFVSQAISFRFLLNLISRMLRLLCKRGWFQCLVLPGLKAGVDF